MVAKLNKKANENIEYNFHNHKKTKRERERDNDMTKIMIEYCTQYTVFVLAYSAIIGLVCVEF